MAILSGSQSRDRRSPWSRASGKTQHREPPSTAFPRPDRWSIFRVLLGRHAKTVWSRSVAMGQSSV